MEGLVRGRQDVSMMKFFFLSLSCFNVIIFLFVRFPHGNLKRGYVTDTTVTLRATQGLFMYLLILVR
jgi:hypothetical protein